MGYCCLDTTAQPAISAAQRDNKKSSIDEAGLRVVLQVDSD
jgi:hypothetical protein